MLSLRAGRFAIKQFGPVAHLHPARVELLARVAASDNGINAGEISLSSCRIGLKQLVTNRAYATQATTAAKPKAHTGRSSTRKTKPTTKKASGAAKPRTKSTKTTATKAKKPKTRRAKAAKPKAKKAVRKPKKALTEEEKKRTQLKELKLKALKSPQGLPSTPWNVLVAEIAKGGKELGNGAREASVKYKNFLPEEREHYNHIANQNKTHNVEAYKAWIDGFTADQIRIANNARAQLRRLTGQPRKWTKLTDIRQVKRPAPPRLLFNKDRWASGDLNGMKVTDVPALMNREWTALSAAERKVYEDQYAQARAQYHAQRLDVYGQKAKTTRGTPKNTTAAP